MSNFSIFYNVFLSTRKFWLICNKFLFVIYNFFHIGRIQNLLTHYHSDLCFLQLCEKIVGKGEIALIRNFPLLRKP